jgi:hypothetical protein
VGEVGEMGEVVEVVEVVEVSGYGQCLEYTWNRGTAGRVFEKKKRLSELTARDAP